VLENRTVVDSEWSSPADPEDCDVQYERFRQYQIDHPEPPQDPKEPANDESC